MKWLLVVIASTSLCSCSLINELTLPHFNSVEDAKHWIETNIHYRKFYANENYGWRTPIYTVSTRQANCSGYAILFADILVNQFNQKNVWIVCVHTETEDHAVVEWGDQWHSPQTANHVVKKGFWQEYRRYTLAEATLISLKPFA